MADYLLRNGNVIDGTGKTAYTADVLVRGDRIESIGTIGAIEGVESIDATGKVICPGFIDPHSHADLTIHRENHRDLLAPLVRQGITTFIGGNCGMSMAPMGGKNYGHQKLYVETFTAGKIEEGLEWPDMGSFLDHVERNGSLLNMAVLAPHGLLRIGATSYDARPASPDEIEGMRQELEGCLEAGAIGMSAGLQYMPGLHSDTNELSSLGEIVARHDGIFSCHLRSYMNTLPQAVDEVTRVAARNDIRAQVSHIMWVPDLGPVAPLLHVAMRLLIGLSKVYTVPLKLDTEIENQLAKLDRLRQKGVEVGMDVMPSTTTFTIMLAFLPPWALQGSEEEIEARFRNPIDRARMLRDIAFGRGQWPHTARYAWSLNLFKILGWDNIRVMSVASDANKKYEGKSILEMALARRRLPFDAVCDLLVEERAKVLAFGALGPAEDEFTEQVLHTALRHPHVSISTDTILMGFGKPSHLFYGCFPRFLGRFCRDKKMLSLENAVRKITGLPAQHFRLKHRGLVREGYFADLVIFDPHSIAPNCSFENPVGDPIGIDHVFINGLPVVRHGALTTDTSSGRVLRNGRDVG